MKKSFARTGILLGLTLLFLAFSINVNAQNKSLSNRTDAVLQSSDGEGFNCFAIIAGKNTTKDGSVIFGHNEDDSGEQMLNIYVVPSGVEKAGEGVLKAPASKVKAGALNAKYIWFEFPGMSVADAAINEHGVCIASDGCNSREDRKDDTDGGVLYEVRMNVAKYASSAREAVKIIGECVEQYGYTGSGRTYSVADPNEGWIVAVVRGRHWVAMRVPDDKVMAIPNYYTITTVDLSDTTNFMGSKDIEDYAVERGWFDPHSRQEFNFRLAYSDPTLISKEGNTIRHKLVIDYLTDDTYDYNPYGVEPMFTPARKLDVQDFINMLSLHDSLTPGKTEHPGRVCNNSTILTTIFQLRSWMNKESGCIAWVAPGHPCSNFFVPLRLGIGKEGPNWARFESWKEAEEKHFTDAKDKRKNYPNGAYWKFVDKWNELAEDYTNKIEEVKKENRRIQHRIFRMVEHQDRQLEK